LPPHPRPNNESSSHISGAVGENDTGGFHLLEILLELLDPRVPGEGCAGEILDKVEEHFRVAGLPIGRREHRADLGIVDDAPKLLQEKRARLLHGHLGEDITVVVAGCLVGEEVRDREQRTRLQPALQ
jgi:hypothetical protein